MCVLGVNYVFKINVWVIFVNLRRYVFSKDIFFEFRNEKGRLDKVD